MDKRCHNRDVCVSVYALAIVLMTSKVMLERIVYIPTSVVLDNLLVGGAITLFVAVFVFERIHSLKQWIWVGGLGIVCLYSSLKMKQYYLLTSYFLMLASVGKNPKTAIAVMNGTKWVFVTISVLWYSAAWLFGNTIYSIERDGRLAHHFGFTHPNNFAMIVCWLILESTYLHYERIRLRHLWMYSVIGFVLYRFTCCNTAMYILFLAAVFLFIDKREGRLQKLLTGFAFVAFPLFAVLNAVCILIYTHREGGFFSIVYVLDQVLTARIRQASLIYSMYGGTFLGQYVPIGTHIDFDMFYRMSVLELDGLYSYLFLCNGMFYTLLFSLWIFSYVRGHKENRVFIALFCIYGVLETHGLNVYLIFPLFLVGQSFLEGRMKVQI